MASLQSPYFQPVCASVWDSPAFSISFTVHPYNKAPSKGGLTESLFLAPLLPHNQHFFLVLLITNLSNLRVHLLSQELFNAYCAPGTAMSVASER